MSLGISREDDLREQIARIIDPRSWAVLEDFSEPGERLKDELSLTLADRILAIPRIREALSPDVWEAIETAPFDKMFLAAIHHGQAGYVVCQAKRTVAGVFDVMEDSCVGWRPGYKPAFWRSLPDPPKATVEEDRA